MKNLLFAALLLSLFSSCKKDNDNQPAPAPEKQQKLTGFLFDDPNYSPETIAYDDQGRVKQVESVDERTTLVYSGNTVTYSEWRFDEQRQVCLATGKLNVQGRMTEITGVRSYSLPEKPYKTTFEYNAAGQMTKRILNINNGESIYEYRYFYQNNNMVTRELYSNGVLDYTGKWEYNTDLVNPWGVNFETFDSANTFTGKGSVKMPSKYSTVRDGQVSWYVDFTYTTDQNGNPKTCNQNYSDGKTLLVTYKYD
jgi:hypothetical protein